MVAYLNNPSASIRKRHAALGYAADKTETLDQEVAKTKRVRDFFEKIENLHAETVLFHGADSLESFVRILSEHGVEREEPHLHTCIVCCATPITTPRSFCARSLKPGKYSKTMATAAR